MGQRYELNDKQISIIAELISINNYNTLKNELSNKFKSYLFKLIQQGASITSGELYRYFEDLLSLKS